MTRIKLVKGVETPNVNWWATENSWCSNSYLAMAGATLYVIDSGLGSLHRSQLVEALATFRGAERVYLLNTHWHLDHCGNGMILEELGRNFPQVHYFVPEAARKDMQGFMERSDASIDVDMGLSRVEWLREGDREEFDLSGVPFSGWRLEGAYLLPTPGHSPDAVSIYLRGERAIFSGDLLWYVNPNGVEGSIEALLQSVAKLRSLAQREDIEYLGGGHFLPLEGKGKIVDQISDYEERERALVAGLEEIAAGRDRVSVDHCLEGLRGSDHPAIKEALRINYPYYPSYLHRFIRVYFREKGWKEVDKEAGGTWSPRASP